MKICTGKKEEKVKTLTEAECKGGDVLHLDDCNVSYYYFVVDYKDKKRLVSFNNGGVKNANSFFGSDPARNFTKVKGCFTVSDD